MCGNKKEFDFEEFGAELAYQRDYPKQYEQEKKKEEIVNQIVSLANELKNMN